MYRANELSSPCIYYLDILCGNGPLSHLRNPFSSEWAYVYPKFLIERLPNESAYGPNHSPEAVASRFFYSRNIFSSGPYAGHNVQYFGPSSERFRANRVDRHSENRLKKASLWDLTLKIIDCYPNSSKIRRLHITYTASHLFKQTHCVVIFERSFFPQTDSSEPARPNRNFSTSGWTLFQLTGFLVDSRPYARRPVWRLRMGPAHLVWAYLSNRFWSIYSVGRANLLDDL